MTKHSKRGGWVACLILVALPGAGVAEDLFDEAGHSLSRSRWITIRFLPMIEIALESDDVVLVQSIDHPPKGLAMRIDGSAVAAECRVTETQEDSYAYTTSTEKDRDDHEKRTTSTTSNITTTTYFSSCTFPEGTTRRAVEAGAITVQAAMTQGNTKPHDLSAKALRKFQRLDK